MVFLLLLLAAGGMLWFSRRPPVITEVNPTRALPGEVVSVVGRNFNSSGRIEVDGIALDPNALRGWHDDEVLFLMPENLRSGMVRIQTDSGVSNAVFLTNRADVPRMGSDSPISVRTVSHREAGRGTVVTIRGEGFGPRTARSRLGFSFPDTNERISVPGDTWWIVRWTNRELRFVVPTVLPSGAMQLVIESETLETDLTLLPPTGTVTYGDEQRYHLRHGLRILDAPDALHVFVPRIPVFPAQPAVTLIEDIGERIEETIPAVWLYRPVHEQRSEQEANEDTAGPADGTEAPIVSSVARTDQVERRRERWEIASVAPVSVLLQNDFQRAFHRYLSDRDGVPVFAPEIDRVRRDSINLRNTPLVIARNIHREVQRRFEPDSLGTANVIAALEGEPANAAAYADLAVALLRVSGLPARRHFGVLIADDQTLLDHRWAEVFLPGVGWVPMDPAIGDGMFGDRITLARAQYGEDVPADTFAALDDRRITVRIDGVPDPPVFPRSESRTDPERWYATASLRVEGPDPHALEDVVIQWDEPSLPTPSLPTN